MYVFEMLDIVANYKICTRIYLRCVVIELFILLYIHGCLL